MKVREVMTLNPITCSSEDDLSSVTMRMWDADCGILPVVDDGRVRAVITDRDICMALTFKSAAPSAVNVGDVIQGHNVYTCSAEDDVLDALKVMRNHQVRRLPVMEDGRLEGLVSMNDIALAARETGGEWPSFGDVVGAMQGICTHRDLPVAA